MIIDDILNEELRNRTYYLEHIKWWIWKPVIKVLIWQRRVWKSSLMKQIIQYLVKERKYEKTEIFYLNKEFPEFDHIKNYNDLTHILLDFIEWKENVVIAIDEIQEIENWQKAIDWLLSKYQKKVDIFITWSNAHLLSWEYATYLTWRYITIPVYPLTFQEYCLFNNKEKNQETFNRFIEIWGLPWASLLWDSKEFIYQYLNSVYLTVIEKDIEPRFKINKKDFFLSLYKYVFANIWNIFSAKSISDYLKNERISITIDTIIDYLSYWEEALLLHKTKSQEIITKKIFSIYNKYYVWDIWLRNSLTWFVYSRDIWLLLENYIYLVLKKYGYTINIGRFKNNKEVDFVAEKYWKIRYIQVTKNIENKETADREYEPLLAIKDNWPKFVVSKDEVWVWENEWIIHVNVMDFEDIISNF